MGTIRDLTYDRALKDLSGAPSADRPSDGKTWLHLRRICTGLLALGMVAWPVGGPAAGEPAAGAVPPTATIPAAGSTLAPDGGAITAAPGIDPLKLMPPSTAVYMNVNLDAGSRYLEVMKGTRLEEDFQKLLTGEQSAGLRTFKIMLALLQGFGSRVGVGLVPPRPVGGTATAPAATTPASAFPGAVTPDILIVVPVADQATVRSEVDLVSRLGATGADWVWTDQPEGNDTVHVATGTARPGQPLPSYALVPGALILSTKAPLVHAAVKQFHGQEVGLGDLPRLQGLAAHIDQTQLMWGFFNPAAVPGIGAGRKPASQIDSGSIPGPLQLLSTLQGAAFSMSMQKNRMEMHILQGYDPDTDIGKTMHSFKNAPIKAPDLAFGRSTAFFDITDMPHAAVLFDQVITPMIQVMNVQLAENPGAKPFADLVGKVMSSLSDVVHGSGGELAVDLGPISAQTQSIPGFVLIQGSQDPKLLAGINSILDSFATLGHQQWSTINVLDTPIKVLSPVTPGGNRMSYGTAGDFHVIAANLDDFKTPLYHSRGVNVANSLAADPQFKQIWNLLGPQAVQLLYLDEHSIVRAGQARMVKGVGVPAVRSTAGPRPSTNSNTKVTSGTTDATQRFGQEFTNDLRGFGEASYPDPMGLSSRVVLTYDPDAAPEGAPQKPNRD